MPRIDDRPAIQIALYDALGRLSLDDIDLKRAGMLLYGLQIASSNLAKHERSAANTEPLVEDIVSSPFLGDLAPIVEIPTADPLEDNAPAPTEEVALAPKVDDAPAQDNAPRVVILSGAKNPRIQPEAPQPPGDIPQRALSSPRQFTTQPCNPTSNQQPATFSPIILAAVQAVAVQTARTGRNREPRTFSGSLLQRPARNALQ